MQEEVVKRTNSSFVVSDVQLGNETKGSVIRARYAFQTQRGYYPDDPHKANQDTYGVTHTFAGEPGDSLFCVFDGHGDKGHDCANYAKKHLPNVMAKHIKQARVKSFQNDLRASGQSLKGSFKPYLWPKLEAAAYEAACRKSFLECNRKMHGCEETDTKLSGTTAVSVSFHCGRATVCNVGDSRVVLGHRVSSLKREVESFTEEKKSEVEEEKKEECLTTPTKASGGKLIAIPLSRDQTPYRKDERIRIQKYGGIVMTVDQMNAKSKELHENLDWTKHDPDQIDPTGDPPRVWEKDKEYPGCAFTRSLGDSIGEKIGIHAEPEIVTADLTQNDEVMVIATDGVFEFLTNQNVIDICNECHDPLEACEKVVRASYEKWVNYQSRTDDITVIVCFLDCQNEFRSKEGTAETFIL